MPRYKLDQSVVPLVDAVSSYVNENRLAFHMPGHMRGGIKPQPFDDIFNDSIFKFDLTEVDGLDYLHKAEGVIAKAQELAADAYGVRKTHFLINGTTVGVHAMMLSSVGQGEKIMLQRNSHRCTVGGLILGGIEPVYINPEFNSYFGEYTAIAPKTLKDALKRHPTTKALLLTTPNYFGLASDVQTLSSLAMINGVRVLVDEAHGAHFVFHPDMPMSAIRCDVDMVTHSAHKTLPTFTQSSFLHVITSRAITDRLRMNLTVLQSSSPSYLLMCMLDATRRFMAIHGQEALSQTIEMASWLRDEINKIEPLKCPGSEVVDNYTVTGFDKTKITIDVSRLGLSGWEVEKVLNKEYGVEIELSDSQNILLFLTVGSKWENIRKLPDILKDLIKQTGTKEKGEVLRLPEIPPLEMLPRKAFYSQSEWISLENTVGMVCADVICPYPPGIPVLIHGELITKDTVDYIKAISNSGAFVQGLVEGKLKVVK
ncbi:MAG TPA: DegT/DnrJ/EryC1/StrS family aminotransferase [Caldisericia bacterium]|nr:DegT/DnrJ/EryC1/StrS family aminotransferase [Caldisericia bacterium]HPF48176.1 DegT/DnrJ/EryC1/StrS family aminotransferase [Caldisericia bacterium]HPI83888.1 DegT/DnrJ/EryC1/StrS family aminotransferase [Caldisericia bacterium]HPQ92629.1 DegT/DnrJ/EryC1/StrS family aminotransferase [Caldisericia bacterium]HRV74273.1 DegT/DnrJ/EryC1/StrS family aminotransferase [Caldisericia bacterium]